MTQPPQIDADDMERRLLWLQRHLIGGRISSSDQIDLCKEVVAKLPKILTALATLRAEKQSLVEALQGLLPTALCGESYGLPDTEKVATNVTFGALKIARQVLAGKDT